MLNNRVLQKSIDDLKNITKIDLCIANDRGEICATTFATSNIKEQYVVDFFKSVAEIQVIDNQNFFKVQDQNNTIYTVITDGNSEDCYTIGKICVSQIKNLIIAYREKYNENGFIQNLLLDNMLLVDIYNRAKSLGIENNTNRVVLLVQTPQSKEINSLEMTKNILAENNKDFITALDEKTIIILKDIGTNNSYDEVKDLANVLLDMFNTEMMMKVKVAFGTISSDLKNISKSYKEAKMTLEVANIFYEDKNVLSYDTLGIGRLIYQLPIGLCKIFMEEVFKEGTPISFDDETIATIYKFFENNLNISETARKLYIHRNTLVYRLDKIQKMTGLDVKKFDDAVAFKLALMVVSYMKYVENKQNS